MVEKSRKDFDTALGDDLNTPEALAAVHELVRQANAVVAEGAMTRAEATAVRERSRRWTRCSPSSCPGKTRWPRPSRRFSNERQQARKDRDFARADGARKKLEELGVILEDTAKGTAGGGRIDPVAVAAAQA